VQPGTEATPFAELTPEVILGAIEHLGYQTSGRFLALNSYENRVYQIGIEDDEPLVAKFYRAGRWPDEAIFEEHSFAAELAARDIPVIAPLADVNGDTLFRYQGQRFAVYPRRGGRRPELEDEQTLRWLGRFLGRLHAVGRAGRFQYRPRLSVERYGDDALERLLASTLLPVELRTNFELAARQLIEAVREVITRVGPQTEIRLHGDFHPGNILWTPRGPHVVDLDDTQSGPAVQDLWLLLWGERSDMAAQLRILLEEYRLFCDFDPIEIQLIEALRALRMLHHCAWVAERWDDPAFPLAFSWFATPRFWESQLIEFREQLNAVLGPVLVLDT